MTLHWVLLGISAFSAGFLFVSILEGIGNEED